MTMDISPFPGTLERAKSALEQQTVQRTVAQLPHQPGSWADMPPDRAATVARGFEAMFIHELYKTMRQAMLNSDDADGDDSFGADILNTLGGIELAEQLARTGRGIGIAQMVYHHLTGSDELPSSHNVLCPISQRPFRFERQAIHARYILNQRLHQFLKTLQNESKHFARRSNMPPKCMVFHHGLFRPS